jgi:D-cysteine desulfhydrase family pyridoxal phosphate-dependent enzyme
MKALSEFPRFPLAKFPTPLERAHRLSEKLGVEVLLKREDLTGLGTGGNKVRKLEFLIADAITAGADTVITSGPIQSNHTRLTAAAANRAGLDCALVLYGSVPDANQGNLLLDRILGAEIFFTAREDREGVDDLVLKVCEDLERNGRAPYLIQPGGAMPIGCLPYVFCIEEILQQAQLMRQEPDYLFCAAGACGTLAGLFLGSEAFNASFLVCGVSVSNPEAECRRRVAGLSADTRELIEFDGETDPRRLTVYDEFVDPGYGICTEEVCEAIRAVATLEGIILDPVYTGKTMMAFMKLVRDKRIPQGSTVLFLHSGGVPSLFAHAEDFTFHV